MEKYNGKPIFDIIVEYDDETGMLRNSFVQNPAVEYERFAFSKLDEFKFEGNDIEQKFMSVSLLANTPILRKNDKGEEFYVKFPKETIKKIVNKLVMQNKINEISFQHNENQIIEGVYLVEHFFSEKGRVESPLFSSVPDGSWITTYWVENKDQYLELKNNPEFRGFSIELNAKIQEAFSAVLEEEMIEKKIREIVFDKSLDENTKKEFIRNLINK